jgi:hypothetical protein
VSDRPHATRWPCSETVPCRSRPASAAPSALACVGRCAACGKCEAPLTSHGAAERVQECTT